MSENMEHRAEPNIKCPYCDWEYEDSWEFKEDSGTKECGSCGEEFNVERCVDVTYNTSRISCEKKGLKHDYKLNFFYERTRDFRSGVFVDLPKNEHSFFRVDTCGVCGHDNHVIISEKEYDELQKSKTTFGKGLKL